MLRTMLKSKIHRATVTQADLHYVGSVTVDEDLMEAADLLEGEQVAIVDVTNGARLETYVITGPRGSGVIGINGAAARLVHPGDLVILIGYGQMYDAEARTLTIRQGKTSVPRVLHVSASLAEALAAMEGRHAERLLTTPRGRPWTLANAQETLARMLRQLELPRYTLHGLRATGPTALKVLGARAGRRPGSSPAAAAAG